MFYCGFIKNYIINETNTFFGYKIGSTNLKNHFGEFMLNSRNFLQDYLKVACKTRKF